MKSLQKKVQPNLRKGCTDTTAVKSQPTTSLFSVKEGVKKTISYEDNDVNEIDDNYENERKKKVMFSPKKDSVVIEILKDISIKDGTSTIILRQETYIKDEINKNVFETEEPCKESTSNVILKLEKKLPENGKSNDKCFEEERDETLLKIEYNLEKRININSSPRADSENQAVSGKDKPSHGNEENNRTVGETSNVPRLTDLGKDFHQPCTVKLIKVFPLPSISTEINKTDVTDEINQVSPEVNDKSELSDKTVRSFSKAENRQRAQLSSPKNHNNKKSNNKEKNKKATGFSVSLKRMKLNRKPSSYSFAVSEMEK
ncbi:hypothetical protein KUTeg_018080 [Tegillarca granosa]|uniref:Uncharacterized protein n=1 Tax=Tegillarca granosa TaxID=220873 RepID=A0ABQ9ELM8_TEGGR|nr:hypothetical protein KUTeg_018080 [Tegillarca granosa]